MDWTFWRKGQQNQTLPLLAGGDVAPQLKDAFRRAAFAHECRTQSFSSPALPENTEWLEAYASSIPQKGWVVIRKTQNIPDAAGEAQITQRESASGLTFFDAIEYLARYETSQRLNGFVPVVDGQVDELGFKHFIACGKREGIAFDVDGMPHATDRGRIVGSGVFPHSAYDDALKAIDEKQGHIDQGPVAFLDPAQFREMRKDLEAYEHANSIVHAACRLMATSAFYRADDAKDDNIAWFFDAAERNAEDEIANSWILIAKNLRIFIRGDYASKTPAYLLPAMNLMRYETLVFNAANLLVHGNARTYADDVGAYYTNEHYAKVQKKAERALRDTEFCGDYEQKLYRDITQCRHQLQEQGKDAPFFDRLARLSMFLNEVVQYHRQELTGITPSTGKIIPPSMPQL